MNDIWLNLLWLPLAFAAHTSVLHSKSGFVSLTDSLLRKLIFPFFGRNVVLGVLLTAFIKGISINEDLNLIANPTIVTLSEIGAFALVLSWLGTMLPACVTDDDISLHMAQKRGSKTFTYVFLRIISCNIVIMFGAFLILQLGLMKLIISIGMAPRLFHYVLYFGQQTLLSPFIAFSIVITAVILSRAYLIAEDAMKKVPSEAGAA